MKYFQTLMMQHQKVIRRHLVIKIIFGVFPFLWISCKTLSIEDNTYAIINSVLDASVEKDSIYFHPKIINKENYIIKTFNPKASYYGNCSDHIKEKLFSDQEMNYYEHQHYNNERWNTSKITNPKIIKHLELKLPESIARYKKLSETIKDEYDLLDRKFMLWTLEHHEGMIKLSRPFFNKEKSHAIVYGSLYQRASLLWILEKKNSTWEVVCQMELSVY